MNSLTPSFDHLAELDFSSHFDAIAHALQEEEVFKVSGRHLIVEVDKIARKVSALDCPILSKQDQASDVAVQFSDEFRRQFDRRIPLLSKWLEKRLKQVLQNDESAFSQWVRPLEELRTASASNPLGLGYHFPSAKGLTKQEVTGVANDRPDDQAILRYHAARIATTTQPYGEIMIQALQSYIDRQEPDLQEDLQELLEDQSHSERANRTSPSDFYRLRDLLDTEAIGKLRREVGIRYLEFLYANTNSTDEHRDLLCTFAQKLRGVEQYLNDPDCEDHRYAIHYAGENFDLRDVLSQSDIFEQLLPIVAIVSGSLGESTDDNGENQYAFGLKLKLNGPVAAKDEASCLSYRVSQLDPTLHQTRLTKQTAIAIVFLYSILFNLAATSSSAAIQRWEEGVLPVFQNNDEVQKQQAFTRMQNWMLEKVEPQLAKLATLLRKLLSRSTSFEGCNYSVKLVVRRSILQLDTEEMAPSGSFFKPILNVDYGRKALKYIAVRPIEENQDDDLISLTFNLAIFDTRCFPRDQSETFGMEYELTNIQSLSILFAPTGRYEERFKNTWAIVFPYDEQAVNALLGSEMNQGFSYQFSFLLLAQVILHVIARAAGSECFLSFFRLALSGGLDPRSDDEYFYRLVKLLEQILGQNNLTSSQGINITDLNKFKISNALRSLYAAVPKRFSFPAHCPITERLAIIVLSSRRCDSAYSNKTQRRITLYGEVVGVEPIGETQVRISNIKKFTGNYTSQDLHTCPTVLFDEVHRLYKMGYRQFIYVASSPHTSTLHLTRAEGDEELYFMSHSIIGTLKRQNPEAKIYPTFFDQHYTVKLKRTPPQALYIQDVKELQLTSTQQSLVYFRLFNGIKVLQQQGAGEDKNFYNGVVTYSALLNAYPDIIDDHEIMNALVRPGSLKNSVLNSLALFHYYRYESSSNISFKLDPYERIIGDKSVGAKSLFNGIYGRVRFNALAFAAEVSAVLEAVPVGESA